MTKNEGNTKKVFIDIYTDWCGWCKKMDKDTFQNPEVAAYMNENFLMVKMDAEGKDPIDPLHLTHLHGLLLNGHVLVQHTDAPF
uniref:Spermatogenesis-associated protein 20-like TRX domain-containing protein n=1 Tax=Hippocampus comes TaxID=109280 RepID=A0A3Q2YUK7_HIPCM